MTWACQDTAEKSSFFSHVPSSCTCKCSKATVLFLITTVFGHPSVVVRLVNAPCFYWRIYEQQKMILYYNERSIGFRLFRPVFCLAAVCERTGWHASVVNLMVLMRAYYGLTQSAGRQGCDSRDTRPRFILIYRCPLLLNIRNIPDLNTFYNI